MKKLLFIFTLSLFLFPTVSMNTIHAEFVNGTTWKDMSESMQIDFVYGYLNCFGYYNEIIKEAYYKRHLNTQAARITLPEYTVHQYRLGITDFYSDYRNELLPINEAIEYVTQSLNGATEEELKESLNIYRRTNK